MLEYISRGCELDLMIAVDCSTTNGDTTKETGLHYCPGQWLVNDYQAAIQKLGRIFEPYSVRQQFTIWGFGATVRGETTPLFPMGSGDGIVKGAKGLLDAHDETFQDNPLYVEAVDEAKLAPLIENAMYQAIHNMKSAQCYSVMCILTAGKIADDIHHLIDTICTAAEDAPLSIVIIGVGGDDHRDDLDSMKMLLNNSSTLRHSNGVPISRDIVRFAAFRDFGYNVSDTIAEGLKEVNEQLVEHFTSNGIQPLRRLISDGSNADLVDAVEEEEEDELMAGSGRSQVSEEDADLSIVSRTPTSRKKRLSLRKKREKKNKDG